MFKKRKKTVNFLAVGDVTTDAFIRLKDAQVHCDINNENCTISMRFGDKIPYESATVVPAVGNSANASVAAARLGLHSALLAWTGDDNNGKECLQSLRNNNVDISLMQIEGGKPTNYHYVLLYEAERTILVKHTEFSYALPPLKHDPKLLYLSSLAPNSLAYHDEITQYLDKHPDTTFAFQPGTFQMQLGYEKLKKLYQRAHLFFCNIEEAQRILDNNSRDIKILLEKMHELGPKTVVITDGPSGAYTYNGTEFLHVPMYPDPKPPVDRTGAGDAFASTFTALYAMDMSIEDCLLRAPINSMSVVQYIGAQEGLLTRDQIEEYLRKKPADYTVNKIAYGKF